jgi:hypothetical protein
MYEAERQNLYAQYRDAVRRISLLSVRDLAQTVRDIWPNATHVILDDSDQGRYLCLSSVKNCDDEIADEESLEDEGVDSMTTAGNFSTENIGRETWSVYIQAGPRGHGPYQLDVEKALAIDPATFGR